MRDDQAAVEKRAPRELPTIVDVPVAKLNVTAIALGLIIAFGLVIAACFCIVILGAIIDAASAFGHRAQIMASISFIAAVLTVGILLVRTHRYYWLNRFLSGVVTGEFVAHLKFVCEHGRVDLHRSGAAWFVKRLADRGVVGHAVRIDAWRKPTPITALKRQFEPRLIVEGSDDFEQFLRDEQGTTVSLSSAAGTAGTDVEACENRSARLTIGRNFGLLLAIAMLAAAAAFYALGGTFRGFTALFAIVALAGIVQHGVTVVARSGGKQWLAVPGGIIIRKPRGFGTRSTLHLMRRSNSLILATRQLTDAFWRVTISDGKLTAAQTMSNNELVVALRAWTSELEPPALEQLSDWTGE